VARATGSFVQSIEERLVVVVGKIRTVSGVASRSEGIVLQVLGTIPCPRRWLVGSNRHLPWLDFAVLDHLWGLLENIVDPHVNTWHH
jgi:hypothetical protein